MTHDKDVTDQFKELTDIGMTPGEQDELWKRIALEMKTMKARRTRHKKRSNAFATSATAVVAVAAVAVVAVGIGVGIDKHVLTQTPTTKTTGASNMSGTTSNVIANSSSINSQAQGSNQWQDVGKMYEVQGTIASVMGDSLVLNVSKNIQGANSSVTNPNYPFQVGSEAHIRFDSSISPKAGDHVVLDVSQYATGGNPFWGVLGYNYYSHRNGSYYNESGQKLTLPLS